MTDLSKYLCKRCDGRQRTTAHAVLCTRCEGTGFEPGTEEHKAAGGQFTGPAYNDLIQDVDFHGSW